MNKKENNGFPLATVITTAVITSATLLSLFFFMGYHFPRILDPMAYRDGVRTAPEGDGAEKESEQLWTCGMHPWVITEAPGLCPICSMELIPRRGDGATASAGDKDERKIIYWKAPMDPGEIYKQPGKSKMGMALVPVYEDEVVSGVDVSIDPVIEQNMGVRMEPVEEGKLTNTIRTYGHITYDETRTVQVSPKVNGWIEKLHVNFTGVQVQRGEPLLEIYSPELLAAQEEYLSLFLAFKKSGGNGSAPENRIKRYNSSLQDINFLESARRRLYYLDVAKEEIQAIESSGKTRKTIVIRSPFSGIVTFKNAIEGGYAKVGTNLYTITDFSRVWVEAHIYEYELGQVKVGQEAEMELPYLPGKTYKGKITFIYPYLQQKTRDVVIRLEFENPMLELKPEMYGDVRIKTVVAEKGMQVPSEAVIRSGERNVIFVSRGNGRFTPREISIGAPLDNGGIQVLTGLLPGEKVITSGQFLLDSESKLQEAVKKMIALSRRSAKNGIGTAHDHSGDAGDMKQQDDFFDDME